MKQTFKKRVSLLLALVMVCGLLLEMPFSAMAANNYTINSTESTDDYYNLISKTDWDIAPGITESQIVLNSDDGSRRQVLFVMEADLNNEYVKVINSYSKTEAVYGGYKTGVMSEQAAVAESQGYNVVGAMNTCLSWYSGYEANRIGEPLGFIMVDAEVFFDPANCGYTYGNVGFPSVLVINKDYDENGNPRPADIPKVEMPQIRSSADLDGWEEQVIPVSSGYIVKDGKNMSPTPNHSPDNNSSAPRSVVGIKPDGTVVIMVNDGRQSPYSTGMSMYELAEVMLDLGCTYAVNCDGGGSTTWLSQRPGEELKVNNSPSDGAERPTTTGILFVSTAPADGAFARANISSEGMYYTPGSTVKFQALGTDLVGTPADIPSSAYWQIAEEGMGTIEDGVFVSSGKTGTVTAQVVYEGKVVGEHSIEIVVPTKLEFASKVMTVPFDSEVTIKLNATINDGVNTVILSANDVAFTTTNEALGTFDGFTFKSVSAENAPADVTSVLTATLSCNPELVATAALNLGKASEVIFDFENAADVGGWNIGDVNGNDEGFVQELSHATTADGQVHDGEGSMRVHLNPIAGTGISAAGWAQSELYPDEAVVIRNAQSLGFWLYIPEDMVHLQLKVHYYYDSKGDGIYDTKNRPTVLDGTYKVFDESGWHYFSVDISAYSSILIPGKNSNGLLSNTVTSHSNPMTFYRFIELNLPHANGSTLVKEYGSINGPYTLYVDNITADYSEAADDREAPIFGTMNLMGENDTTTELESHAFVTTSNNVLSLFAKVSEDTRKTNATGLNIDSAKAYVDGKEVEVALNNGIMSISGITVADGMHRIKFEICDNMGNKSSVVRMVSVNAGTNMPTVQVVPADPSLDRLYGGSVYWMNVNATDIETVQSVTTAIDLNNVNHWELDHMVVADGFTAEYTVNAETNTAYITISRTGKNEQVGEATLASLPIRVIYFDTDIRTPGYTAETYWAGDYEFWAQDVKVDVDMGMITFADGTTGTFSNEEFSVDTEWYIAKQFMDPAFLAERGTSHVHTLVAMQDVPATCLGSGYSDRTFCNVCNSVVDWGKTIPTEDHDWQVNAEGKLACSACKNLFNGEYSDGKTYVDGVLIADGWYNDTYYFINGVKVTGQRLIDGTMCTFDDNGVYLPDFSYTGFYHDGNGWMYFQANFQKRGFITIDGNTHYFDDATGYAPIGTFTLAGDRVYKVEGEKGKVLGAWDTFIVNGVERRRYYYSLRYYKNQWLEVDGEMYYFNNDGYALIGKRAVARSGEYLGGYEFADDGRLIAPITGPFVDAESGYMYFAENGVMVRNKLVKFENDYYFARGNYLLITWSTYISEEQANGLLPAGEYQFGADGKLVMHNGPVADAYNSAYLNFYKDGVRVYEEGLYEYDGGYYYVRSNGLLDTWAIYVSEEQANGLLPAGEYQFGADGKLVMHNGPVADAYNSAYLNFYKDGVRIYEEGLYEYDGDYYYVRSNGLLATWGIYVSEEKANGLVPAGEYQFGADGKMIR